MNRNFIRINWISLVFIYLVVIAGSVVRTTGSGMGCPDWPKCFGKWVPPTEIGQLPKNYKEIYGEKRVKKVEKFAKFLTVLGMKETAKRIKNDPATYEDESFNPARTWTEYINRLVGFVAGNLVLIIFIWSLIRYRKHKNLVMWSFLNLIIIGLEGWFGSIVVATNLVPWTITVHLFLAFVIIAIQLKIIRLISPKWSQNIYLTKQLKWLIVVIFLITFYQLFLGTQVREYIDFLTKQGLGRESWANYFGWSFFIHRSFSWLVLILIGILTYINYKRFGERSIYWLFGILVVELIGGVLLAYADMPGAVQVSHLLFASILFGISFMQVMRVSVKS